MNVGASSSNPWSCVGVVVETASGLLLLVHLGREGSSEILPS